MKTIWKIIIVLLVLASIYLVLGNLLNFSTSPHAQASSPEVKHVSVDGNLVSSGLLASEKGSEGSTKQTNHISSQKVASKAKQKDKN